LPARIKDEKRELGRRYSRPFEVGLMQTYSKDGTIIAYEQSGQGPALIIVGGILGDRSQQAGLAQLLASHFTVYNFDRRGRGESGFTPPYAVEREVEDIAAILDAAGGSAFVYGTSGCAVLSLEAAARGLSPRMKKLALWIADPAFGFPPGTPPDAHTISWHGLLHFVTAGIGFLALIAACMVMARRFASQGLREWAIYSVVSGILFFAAFVGVATGSGQSWSVIGFWIGVLFIWAWISILAARLRKES
jgi:Protein of unknown function (DUF998)/alpha/beta hydrolase fold